MFYIYGTNDPENQPYTLFPIRFYEFETLLDALQKCREMIVTECDPTYLRVITCLFPPNEIGEMQVEQFSVAFWYESQNKFIKF